MESPGGHAMHIDEQAEQGRVMDRLVAELQLLRLNAGDVSYSQIADRVRELRQNRGETGSAAFVGRTTIYDAFQPGRHRISPDLIADIASALGEDAESAARWRRPPGRTRAASAPGASRRTAGRSGGGPTAAPRRTAAPP